jgi:cleavage and polyadenylation specificity factor subunit 1
MYSLYKTLHAPTGVEQSVYCYFLNSKEASLITASGNQLHVYHLNTDGRDDKTTATMTTTQVAKTTNDKLKFECVEKFDLFGNVCSMACCRYGNMTKDALILAFMDAKLAIVEYDLNTRDLNTLSIHYFEDEIQQVCKWHLQQTQAQLVSI